MAKSKSMSIDREDLMKWLKNMVVFWATALIVFLTAVQSGVSVENALLSLYTWGISTIIDLLKKFIQNNPTQ